MLPKKIMPIIGTRPEAIKLAPVIRELEKHPDFFSVIPVVTAQHREMLDQVLEVFRITPKYDLNIMAKNQTLTEVTQKAIGGIHELIKKDRPDMLLAQGDTTTVFSAALMAFYERIPFGHVEAGLRTYNNYDPFPEEINRRLTGPLAELHFAPTKTAETHLLNEKIPARKIFVTGNTVIDALLYILDHEDINEKRLLDSLQVTPKKFILVTAHRRESFGEPFRNICQGLKMISETYPDWKIVYPVHLNPNVQKPVHEILEGLPNVVLTQPLDYFRFVHLMKHAHIILTDSGGIQEEAPSLGIPVLVMREVTERPEAVEAGTVRIVGTHPRNIFGEVKRLMDNKEAYLQMARAINPYGDGNSAYRIVDIIRDYFKIP
ncbi:MAG: UDP-N-acetylglucosamine 2-epimerase (non-hydrolyzing) [Candidatus Auribacterota bacterium]|jgi:UDP-N-acetylglucosamine 2-epimerase (non-hydrolysing)|nr:UDP-N-acetylglucosamine 2-epimerase (non-hydrolyzing) [Candidatus Auribacterota bacterium]